VISNKPVIAIDIDDVLAANAEGFVKFSNERWGTSLVVSDYSEHWAEVWQVELDETQKRAQELHDSGVISSYGLIAQAEIVLQKLHEHFTIIAVTSRRISIEIETRAWLDKHFHGVIDDIRFAGIFDGPIDLVNLSRTKKDIFLAINASYVIDDYLKHCLAAAELGVEAVLFGNYTWNQADTLPAHVTRCVTWQDVDNFFSTFI
jgi:5'(3')-deoxyribonucleotidase